ncbi:DUF2937 family protein [Pannonibacter phragmitetus]|uniref:DUF2937 domain-containing protein n=1 Tax=Pannonibacter phragmitetus TaxID=121719 RepID=A0A0U3E6G6_9HYPH|nr:DUF2937 family protein [Pannonibacter phragmitetus]ALV27185.1 hypothetical protein APZ00_09035 [Pannonibacter phragmitetus]
MMLARPVALAFGLLAGITASQLPEFAQQYRQRLGGAIDALQTVMLQAAEDAQRSGLDVDGAIARLKASGDQLVAAQGRSLEEIGDRLANMRAEREAYAEADEFGRLLVFLTSADRELARRTYDDFEPAVPVTAEGILTGILGLFAGLGSLRISGAFLRGLWRVFGPRRSATR